MPTIADQGITTGTVTLYEQGDWFGDVSTNSGERIPDGTRVDLVVENVTLSGAIVRGNISGDVGRYQVAGRPEWSTPIKPRAYQSSGAVLRSTVFADVAREALGSSWQSLVVAPSEASLGGHLERMGANGNVQVLARDVLGSLGLSWYVRNDGITFFGTRPSGTVTTDERILVSSRNDAIGLRYVNCEDVAAFAPGLAFEDEIIGELSYLITPEDVSLQVWTRAASNAFSDLVRMAWRRLFPRIELQGLYSYSTAGLTSNGKHSLRSTGSRSLPDINLAETWTIAGHTAEFVPGTHVLVAFADGNPAKPVIVAIDPSTLPASSSFDVAALGSIEFGAAEAHVLRSGDPVTVVPSGPAPPIPGNIFLTSEMLPAPILTVIPTKVKA
jgi:hypothetical protein